jgi:hypothetical protein
LRLLPPLRCIGQCCLGSQYSAFTLIRWAERVNQFVHIHSAVSIEQIIGVYVSRSMRARQRPTGKCKVNHSVDVHPSQWTRREQSSITQHFLNEFAHRSMRTRGVRFLTLPCRKHKDIRTVTAGLLYEWPRWPVGKALGKLSAMARAPPGLGFWIEHTPPGGVQ